MQSVLLRPLTRRQRQEPPCLLREPPMGHSSDGTRRGPLLLGYRCAPSPSHTPTPGRHRRLPSRPPRRGGAARWGPPVPRNPVSGPPPVLRSAPSHAAPLPGTRLPPPGSRSRAVGVRSPPVPAARCPPAAPGGRGASVQGTSATARSPLGEGVRSAARPRRLLAPPRPAPPAPPGPARPSRPSRRAQQALPPARGAALPPCPSRGPFPTPAPLPAVSHRGAVGAAERLPERRGEPLKAAASAAGAAHEGCHGRRAPVRLLEAPGPNGAGGAARALTAPRPGGGRLWAAAGADLAPGRRLAASVQLTAKRLRETGLRSHRRSVAGPAALFSRVCAPWAAARPPRRHCGAA